MNKIIKWLRKLLHVKPKFSKGYIEYMEKKYDDYCNEEYDAHNTNYYNKQDLKIKF